MKFLDEVGFSYFANKLKAMFDKKVDKVNGKGLSTEDYTTTERNKLSGIETGANKYIHPSTHSMSMITGTLGTDSLREPHYVTASTPITARPLFDVMRGDRTAFLPADQIIIEESTDAGKTWVDAKVSDSNKAKLFTGQRPSIRIPLKDGVKSTDCIMRVTISAMKYNVPDGTPETERYGYWNPEYLNVAERYTTFNEGWIWLGSNSDRITMTAERATGSNPDKWTLEREALMSGWSGGNYFSLSGSVFGGGSTQVGNSWNWRFSFRTTSPKGTFVDSDLSETYPSSSQTINHIKIGGRNVHKQANNYMYNEHLYSWDEHQNAKFPKNVHADDFIGNFVGLENVTNTSDANKPVSVAQQSALNLKADKSQVLTDVPKDAKFTQTTINGKTGVISKADVVALGIPAQDTVVDISGKADKKELHNHKNMNILEGLSDINDELYYKDKPIVPEKTAFTWGELKNVKTWGDMMGL